MTALASSCRDISSSRVRASSASAASSVSTRYLPARTSVTESKPRACNPSLMVRPAGSLTTGLRVTKTSALNTGGHRLAPARQPPQRLEVPLAGAGDNLGRQRRRRRLLVPAELLEVVAQVLLVE